MRGMRIVVAALCYLLSLAAFAWIPYAWITLSLHTGSFWTALRELYVEGGIWFLRMNYLLTALSVALGTAFFIAGISFASRNADPGREAGG